MMVVKISPSFPRLVAAAAALPLALAIASSQSPLGSCAVGTNVFAGGSLRKRLALTGLIPVVGGGGGGAGDRGVARCPQKHRQAPEPDGGRLASVQVIREHKEGDGEGDELLHRKDEGCGERGAEADDARHEHLARIVHDEVEEEQEPHARPREPPHIRRDPAPEVQRDPPGAREEEGEAEEIPHEEHLGHGRAPVPREACFLEGTRQCPCQERKCQAANADERLHPRARCRSARLA
eukprot:CAMPEP_0206061988 /NCGR_PEP_ID=MMETSP1466-20131121/55751_1 /ASSEMBLY_ACC=CAM_ASM_001126 /TAXON_ID=44452 /ORGANISM="Pavlova gyrans, Strain CCMP608" /LENGTH=236 /DNA_ID=CAMNT_0053437345 /DNA_START=8 /DNA_END=715 /DNA_ORIENTATION=+